MAELIADTLNEFDITEWIILRGSLKQTDVTTFALGSRPATDNALTPIVSLCLGCARYKCN